MRLGAWRGLVQLGLLSLSLAACSSGEVASNQGRSDVRRGRERLGSGEWDLPESVRQSGEAQHVSYDDAPPWSGESGCSGSFTEGAQALGDYIKSNFSGVSEVQGYNCRKNTASSSKTSIHGTGRAIDIMIPPSGGADSESGDPIANWLVENAEQIGVQYIIWNHTAWNGSRSGRKDKPYTGPNPHTDHIHCELNEAGASRQTSWFQNGGDSQTPSSSDGNPSGSDGTDGATDPGSEGGGCGSVDEAGTCSGATLKYCDGGQLKTLDCGQQGMTCGDNAQQGYKDCVASSGSEPGSDDEEGGTDGGTDGGSSSGGGCGSVTDVGQCQGSTLRYCDNGELVTNDCGSSGCGMGGSGYYDCGVSGSSDGASGGGDDNYYGSDPGSGGCSLPSEGECDGDTLRYCTMEGQEQTVSCGAQGMSCGWSAQSSYYDCL